ncbi:MAG: TetR/AcrR family transcriptional regulator [Kofleriaceae bacterium]
MNVRSDNAPPPTAAVRRSRGRPLIDDKRRIILDAALRVFAERGFHGTNVPEVAARAGVGVGTLYRYFENKEALVNQVYRDAKQRLRAALLDGAASVDLYKLDAARIWFLELWRRLGTFAKSEPDAFRFLEMQDHTPYLDAESRELELSVLAPLWMAGKKLRDRTAGAPVDMLIALLWGAFVGLIKAERLGYLRVDDKQLALAGEQCWRLIAPDQTGPVKRPRTDLRYRVPRVAKRSTR